MMLTAIPHVSVCICTYRRQALLARLLSGLSAQETGGKFTFSIVVADNDRLESAREVATRFAAKSSIAMRYCVEARQNIALARNKAVENAAGEFVSFIDDDEFPPPRWLLTLFEACDAYAAAGVLGPVKPHFDVDPPKWVVKGRFYDRATYPTGLVIDWRKGRTGNVLLRRSLFVDEPQPFRPEFLSGEDQDFFRRMIEKGHRFVWCNEALAYEEVPPLRWRRTFMLRRALLRGAVSVREPHYGAVEIARSIAAVPAYALMLPFAQLFGHHYFMNCLIRLCDHAGALLALVGIRPIKESYVTE